MITLSFTTRKLIQRLVIASLGLSIIYFLIDQNEINSTTTLDQELAELIQKGEQAGYEYTVALPLWQQGLKLAKNHHYQSYLAKFNARLGSAYNKLGQYDQAWLYLNQALTIYLDNSKINNSSSPNHSPDKSELNQHWNLFSLYDQAKTYWNQIYHSNSTTNHDINKQLDNYQLINNRGQVLKELGILYRSLARYQPAVDYFQQAADNYHQIEELTGKAAILTEMAIIDYQQQQYDSALEKLSTALDLYQRSKDNQGISEVLTQIGIIYRQQHKYLPAIEKLDDAFKIITEPSKQGNILVQQGITYRENKQYDKAISSLERARFFYSNSETKNHVGESDALTQMGLLEFERNQYKAAIHYFTLALDISNKINNRQGQWNNLVQLARVYRQQQQDETALNQFWQALAVDMADDSMFVTTRAAIYDEMIQFLQPAQVNHQSIPTPTAYYPGLKVFELKINRLFSGWFSQYRSLLPTEPVTDLTTLAKELLPSEVLLIYNVMADKTLLWIITGGDASELQQVTLSITAVKLTQQLDRLYNQGIQPASLLEKNSPATPNAKQSTTTLRQSWRYLVDTNYQLYRQLFPRPVQQLLNKIKPQTLYIIPTGALCYLPFEALITQKRYDTPHYLIQNYTLAYIPSITLFSKWRHQLIKQSTQFRDHCQTVSTPQVQELFSQLPSTTTCLAKLTQPIKDKKNISNIAMSLMLLGVPNAILKLWPSVNDSILEVEAVKENDTGIRYSLMEQVRQAKLAVLKNNQSYYHHPYFWANSLVYGVEM